MKNPRVASENRD